MNDSIRRALVRLRDAFNSDSQEFGSLEGMLVQQNGREWDRNVGPARYRFPPILMQPYPGIWQEIYISVDDCSDAWNGSPQSTPMKPNAQWFNREQNAKKGPWKRFVQRSRELEPFVDQPSEIAAYALYGENLWLAMLFHWKRHLPASDPRRTPTVIWIGGGITESDTDAERHLKQVGLFFKAEHLPAPEEFANYYGDSYACLLPAIAEAQKLDKRKPARFVATIGNLFSASCDYIDAMLEEGGTKTSQHATDRNSVQPVLSAEQRAMAVIAAESGLTSLAAVAKKARCTPQALAPEKAPIFRRAWEYYLANQEGAASTRRGYRDKEGNLEAWSDSESPETDQPE